MIRHAEERWRASGRQVARLLPGDVVHVSGTSWLSRRIKRATRERGEPPSLVSHSALVVTAGDIVHAEIIEAVARVVRRTLGAAYLESDSGIAVSRMVGLTMDQRLAIAAAAVQFDGRAYGWLKLPLHLLDSWAGRITPSGRSPYLFRRLAVTPWPICSPVVVTGYLEAIGYTFGRKPPGQVQLSPDDIHDHCISRSDQWEWPIGPSLLPLRVRVQPTTEEDYR